MKPGRLAIFLRSLAGGGGAERVMVNLAGALTRRGHPVDLVLGRREGNFLDDLSPEVRLLDLGRGSWPQTAALAARDLPSALRLLPPNPPRILSCAPALVRYLRTERPVGMLSALNYTNLTALWARRLAGCGTRLVVSEHNTLSQRAAQGPGRVRSLPRKVRHFYRQADALAAVVRDAGALPDSLQKAQRLIDVGRLQRSAGQEFGRTGELVRFKPTATSVNMTLDALRAVTNLPATISPPAASSTLRSSVSARRIRSK